MKVLVVYDITGTVWNVIYGSELEPGAMTVAAMEIPEGSRITGVDLSDPKNPNPVYETASPSETDRILEMMTELKDEVKASREDTKVLTMAAGFSAISFSDDQAVQVPGLYPEWNGNGTAYKTGTRLRYTGVLYKVLQDHTSQDDWTPDASPALFAEILIPDPGVIPEWKQPESTNGYAKGDQVVHGGKTWESLVDNNVWEPGISGTETLWKEWR